MRMLLPRKQEPLSIGRPRDGRRWGTGRRALGKAPGPRSQSLRLSAFRGQNPEMRRPLRLGGQKVIVADFKRIMMFLEFLLVLRLVRSDIGNLLPIGPPGVLLDAIRRFRNFARFAAGHRENENLRGGLFSRPLHGDKRQAVAARRPPRGAYAFAFVSQHTLRSRGDFDQYEPAVAAVLLEIRARHRENNALAVRRNLRIGNGSDFRVVAQFQMARFCQGGLAREESCEQ